MRQSVKEFINDLTDGQLVITYSRTGCTWPRQGVYGKVKGERRMIGNSKGSAQVKRYEAMQYKMSNREKQAINGQY